MVKPLQKKITEQLNLMSISSLVSGEIFILGENIGYKHLYMSVILKM